MRNAIRVMGLVVLASLTLHAEAATHARRARHAKAHAVKTASAAHAGKHGRARRAVKDEDDDAPAQAVTLSTHARAGTRHSLIPLKVPPPMKGSRLLLVQQNVMADKEGLERVKNDERLIAMRLNKELVALPVGGGLKIDPRLPVNRRYCRPWTAKFLTDLGRAHRERFGAPLQVNSAVRTVAFQDRLRETNGNAAPSEGETASPHLSGAAIDIGKKGMSIREIGWMRGYLMPLQEEGKITVEEEFQQACFHISVYKQYVPPTPVKLMRVAAAAKAPAGGKNKGRRRSNAALMAARIR